MLKLQDASIYSVWTYPMGFETTPEDTNPNDVDKFEHTYNAPKISDSEFSIDLSAW